MVYLGVLTYTCNPSIWEAEAGWWQVGSQSGLYSENLLQEITAEKSHDRIFNDSFSDMASTAQGAKANTNE